MSPAAAREEAARGAHHDRTKGGDQADVGPAPTGLLANAPALGTILLLIALGVVLAAASIASP